MVVWLSERQLEPGVRVTDNSTVIGVNDGFKKAHENSYLKSK
jgi:hypothetical protein